MTHETYTPSKHLGRKIMRMRELLGITQEVVAEKVGISQQSISKIEQNENVDDETLKRIAKALGVSPEAIKDLTEYATVYNIVQNHEGATNNQGAYYQCTFNPIDKLVETIDKLEKLYEALLKSEREKVAMLQKLLDERK